jgi:hypothetical protein
MQTKNNASPQKTLQTTFLTKDLTMEQETFFNTQPPILSNVYTKDWTLFNLLLNGHSLELKSTLMSIHLQLPQLPSAFLAFPPEVLLDLLISLLLCHQ